MLEAQMPMHELLDMFDADAAVLRYEGRAFPDETPLSVFPEETIEFSLTDEINVVFKYENEEQEMRYLFFRF